MNVFLQTYVCAYAPTLPMWLSHCASAMLRRAKTFTDLAAESIIITTTVEHSISDQLAGSFVCANIRMYVHYVCMAIIRSVGSPPSRRCNAVHYVCLPMSPVATDFAIIPFVSRDARTQHRRAYKPRTCVEVVCRTIRS